ncbi:DUF2116 family Zn-ribbon domain-containing protein [Candidatus Woesearchaeota archaeon]|nr:DUF2116 family Zn-ribbon domain-containing protein [Candidatus Woesearchaeota archaeon]
MKDCPICNKEIFSNLGNGCRICGMPVNYGDEFCSNRCEKIFHHQI